MEKGNHTRDQNNSRQAQHNILMPVVCNFNSKLLQLKVKWENLLSSADGTCPAWAKMTLAAAKQCLASMKHCCRQKARGNLSVTQNKRLFPTYLWPLNIYVLTCGHRGTLKHDWTTQCKTEFNCKHFCASGVHGNKQQCHISVLLRWLWEEWLQRMSTAKVRFMLFTLLAGSLILPQMLKLPAKTLD